MKKMTIKEKIHFALLTVFCLTASTSYGQVGTAEAALLRATDEETLILKNQTAGGKVGLSLYDQSEQTWVLFKGLASSGDSLVIGRYNTSLNQIDTVFTINKNGIATINKTLYIGDQKDYYALDPQYVPDYSLFVENGIFTQDFNIVQELDDWVSSGGPDYVFEEDYSLLSLEELEQFVKQEKHLPGVPGANKIDKEGYYSADAMFKGQLKNIEELVLHTIAQEKKIEQQSNAIESLLQRITALEKRLDQ